MQLTPKQLKKIERLLKVEKGGIVGILEYLYELEEKMDTEIPSIKDIIARVKGDKGDDYILTNEDKKEIAPIVRELISDNEIVDKVLSRINIDYNIIAKKASEYITVPKAEKVDYNRIKKEVLEDIVVEKGDKGDDADEVVIINSVVSELQQGLPMFGEAFRDGLELLQGDNRLSATAIKGIEDYPEVSRLAKESQFINRGGNGKGLLSQQNDVNITDPTNDQVLKYNSTTGKWVNGTGGGSGTYAGVSLTKSAPQTLGTDTYTAITFDVENFDTDTMHSGASPSRITFTTGGKYLVTGHAGYVSNNCAIKLKFVVNGTDNYAEEIRNNTAAGNESISISMIREFSAGDYIELFLNTISGSFDANPGCLFAATALETSSVTTNIGTLNVTTTGTSGPATLLGSTLNIPQYQGAITIGTTAQYFRGDLSLATFPTLVSTFTNDAGYLTTISGGDHNTLSNLTVGDVHTQYVFGAGRATPQTIALGTASGANTGYITSTAHATKGKYFLNAAGTIAVDELNARLGIGIATPTQKLHVVGTGYVSSFFGVGAIASGSYNFEVTGSSNFSSTTYFRGITYHFNGTNNYFGMQAISTTNKIFTTSGTTNKDIVIQNGDVTTALFNNASSIATVTIGTAGATLGQLALTGNTSGTITIKGQAAAGSYNFNLPTSAGSSGQPLLSGGGASAAMTFGTLGVNAGGTGATSMTTNGIAYGSATMSYTSSSNNAVLVTSGTGTPSLSSVLPDSLTLLGVTFQDTGKNITFGSSIGTKIGTATNQKLAFYNSNPIVQPANTVAIDTLLSNLGLRATGGSANFALKITNALPQTLKAYTVATLPAGVVGDMAYVTDALAPTYLTALTGGGAITVSCFYNGTAWVAS